MWRYFSAKNTTVYLDVLPKLVDDYNNAKHSTIKMTPAQASKKGNESKVRRNLYGDMEPTLTKPKFKVGDKVRTSKYKGTFEKGTRQTGLKKCSSLMESNSRIQLPTN